MRVLSQATKETILDLAADAATETREEAASCER